MTRVQGVLTALISILLIILFWFLLWSPMQDELAAIEESIEEEQLVQEGLRTTIAELRAVREQAPASEAQLAAAGSVVTREPALPSALRQLQLAADEAGVTLRAVSTTRPTSSDANLGLAGIGLAVQLEGGYFQTVDFLRRVEDPAIMPRAVLWDGMTVTILEYPELSVSLTGQLFVVGPVEELPDEEVEEDGLSDVDDAEDGVEPEDSELQEDDV